MQTKGKLKTSETGPHTELLTFDFPAFDKTSTTAELRWAEKRIPFKIDVDVTEIVLAQVRKDLQGQKGFTDQNWNQAANWSMNNGGDLEEALAWSDAAISAPFIGVENYNNLQTKAQILNKMGKTEEADKIMDTATFASPHQYSVGVKHVFVNGTLAISSEKPTGALAGRALRHPSSNLVKDSGS